MSYQAGCLLKGYRLHTLSIHSPYTPFASAIRLLYTRQEGGIVSYTEKTLQGRNFTIETSPRPSP